MWVCDFAFESIHLTEIYLADPGATMTFVAGGALKPIGGHILSHASATRMFLRKGQCILPSFLEGDPMLLCRSCGGASRQARWQPWKTGKRSFLQTRRRRLGRCLRPEFSFLSMPHKVMQCSFGALQWLSMLRTLVHLLVSSLNSFRSLLSIPSFFITLFRRALPMKECKICNALICIARLYRMYPYLPASNCISCNTVLHATNLSNKLIHPLLTPRILVIS